MADCKVNDNKNDLKLEVTQDKIIDILMHSATRQDISEIRAEMHSDKKELKAEISDVRTELTDTKKELKADIAHLDAKIERLEGKIDSNFKWTLGVLLITILVPIALHFVK